MPVWLQILFFGSLMSAIMSTCSGALLAPASLLSENIIKPQLKEKLSDRSFLAVTRMCVIIISVLSFILAMGKQNIFELVSESSVIGLVTIFVPFVAALFFDHTHSNAAIASMMTGTAVYIIFRFFLITEINPLLPGFCASILGLFLGQMLPSKDRLSDPA
ncbi:MAG: hypothetical protein IPP49_21365 [Saprospiraceae bacterium]|nr:hypothetical protein [Saprospiraceae bacterium]